ncbi:MAG TPA: VOC family protein [Chloroflexia bacterium]|nr:VOC family protein [Chloroflexia bacterium]
MTQPPIPGPARIGHVHLKVADLERSIGFYCDVLGFELVCHLGTAAFVAAGGYHHHIGLNTWESAGGAPPPAGTTGLYHFAINYPTRRDLAAAFRRLLDAGWTIDGCSDHTSHEALYLHDPDFNGIELAWDRDPSYWRPWYGATQADMPALNHPLDLDALLAELASPVSGEAPVEAADS